MLRLSKEGHIFTVSELDGKSVLLENEDLYNNVFQSFEIEEDFSFVSFFKMVKQYPLFLKFFQQGASYLEEYELIENIREDLSSLYSIEKNKIEIRNLQIKN